MTFDLAEIEELMHQQARKQLEAELAAFAVCIQLFWSVQSSPQSRFYRDPKLLDMTATFNLSTHHTMHVNGWLQDPQGSAQQQYQDTHDNPQTSTSSCHPLQLRKLRLIKQVRSTEICSNSTDRQLVDWKENLIWHLHTTIGYKSCLIRGVVAGSLYVPV